ncbi:MAG: hypothetical protein LWX55_11415 [Deltaproteobacteria bacterium]|jgi:ABC-type ATPase involved in cell division|nr:hypothetical protein [Deltaproteobacteria bacterium]
MQLIKLVNYSVESPLEGSCLRDVNFSLNRGEGVSVVADVRHDVRLFMRGLASLVYPARGSFFFRGKELDFSDYRNLLGYKQKVGYVASDASFISNLSVQDNLMLTVNYFENRFPMRLSDDIMKLCMQFGLDARLDLRPSCLDPEKMRISVIIRETCKRPDILLIERPKEFLGTASYDMFKSVLRSFVNKGVALIFYTLDEDFSREFSTRRIWIEDGKVVENGKQGIGVAACS